jgi:hypothetical protein
VSSNSIALVDRETVSGAIEGVDFGPKLWVIARSPTAVLVWIFGHSWSNNGRSQYAEPHLTLLADRSPKFMYQPRYKSFRPFGRIHRDRVQLYSKEICEAFGADALEPILQAVEKRRTAIIEGGGGSLLPFKCYGDEYKHWRAAGGGFIVRPEGVTEHDTMRYKLGWQPKP